MKRFFLSLALAVAAVAECAALDIAVNGKAPEYTIVIAKDAHPAFKSASKEFADFSLRNLIRPVIIISDDTMVDEAFEMLRKKRTSIAVLRSKEGKTTGVMTIEDALESLVGDIDDEEYIKEAIGIGS